MHDIESELRTTPHAAPSRHGIKEATREDLYFAYRLLLGREPDDIGWEHYLKIIADQKPSVHDVVQYFLGSAEFIARQGGSANAGELAEVELGGFSLFTRSDDRDIGTHIQATAEYEPHVTAAMRDYLRPGHVFVDVGANIGFFTNLAAHIVGPQGFVVAVEPMDKNVQLIYRSLEKNRSHNVRVHACAASDRMGLVALTTDAGTSNGQILAATSLAPRTFYTQTRPLDEMVADLDRIDLVKLDIEGYELLALRGFRAALKKHKPTILTEFHPYCMRTYVGIDPAEYLRELFEYASRIRVLEDAVCRTICANAEQVMRRWERADKAARNDGTTHIDLLVEA